ncbi:hypothetical protein [Mobiluncus mulieris]|uniref:hypothetical protein n=1 Tax=Mobiluncus mulieris TaxID=2052 RepID=UPI0011123AFD|nr:hypothetical protein [Mobiluncus mulieris]
MRKRRTKTTTIMTPAQARRAGIRRAMQIIEAPYPEAQFKQLRERIRQIDTVKSSWEATAQQMRAAMNLPSAVRWENNGVDHTPEHMT